ncbi:penicillin-binding protein [Actinoallomurus purpureus]|uniref:transglycosylase domain-containing protein n=1 Tax=Actinoallomurus purpureus TaxID=478114 RepID=UPI0020935062|nr:transglycosylase domain-containing protein [Actinoallomurus purpureus]MCO6007274.1 penicillin-binding protein [Actinoallomurus purpureus]
MGVAYAMVKVPKINASVQEQGTTIYWGDSAKNPKVMGRFGATRQMLPSLDKVSPPMQAAALAAEDRHFYHEAAISPTGIGRAVYNNLTGGDTQGGSTVTQQYVKNAYLEQERTFTRKFKEIFIAVKVNKQNSKDQILLDYLNTIYFGAPVKGNQGAFSVESAARIWFGTTAQKLTIPQAALLASNIKQPGYYTPLGKGQQHTDTLERYNWVLQGMRTMGKISDADVARYQNHLPSVRKSKGSAWQGQNGYILERVRQALLSMKTIDQTKIETGGLRVYTSWDPDLQQKAAAVVKQRLRGMPSDTRVGVVTIDAKTGEVKAAYGGKDFTKRSVDDAYFSTAQVGSSFKPFVLATALKQGISLKTTMDATNPAYINTSGDRVPRSDPSGHAFYNDEGNTNKVVNLVDATADSLNTVYVPLGFKAHWQNVLQVAEDAGLPKAALQRGHPGEGGFFLGQSDMRPLDLAGGYATLANDGTYIVPHSIRRVEDSKHKMLAEPSKSGKQVIPSEVIKDVQFAMQAVVKRGTGKNAQLANREVAGKTGTTNDNYAAWFSGFTPPTTGSKPKQYVTTVGMWRYVDQVTKGKHKHAGYYKKLQNVGGYGHINGGDLPARIWHDYMTQALDGTTTGSFPPPAYVGENKMFATPSPTATTPTPSPTPTCQEGQIPQLDHCKPSKTQDPTDPRGCIKHPNRPQCHSTGPTSPTPTGTCKPWDLNCSSPTPGSGGGGGGRNETQGRAARPFRE